LNHYSLTMTFLHTIIYGIVEGITEFLPISSTGHLILASKLLKITQTDFVKSFEIAIQLGAICSVVFLYWRRLFVDRAVLKRLIVAFVPTAIIGFIFYKIIKSIFLGSEKITLWALLVGGLFLIIFELVYKEKESAIEDMAGMTYKQAFFIGVCQSIAVVPGVSRAAATIIGGLMAGMKRKTIVEFSFLLAVPTMLAATGFDILKSAGNFNLSEFGYLASGFIVSFIVAIIAIKFLLSFIKSHTFITFGFYRIIIAIIFFWLAI